MMRALGLAAILAGMAALTACETGPPLSSAQCQVADWRAMGFADGAQGRPAERYVALEQACAAAGFASDQRAYLDGRREGLFSFCQPARAFQLGLSGSSYGGVCPAELDAPFRFAYGDGRRAYDARTAYDQTVSKINSLRSERDDIEHKLDANELGFQRSQSDAERERHKAEINRLRRERREVEDRLHDAERDSHYRLDDLDDVRARIGLQYGPW